MKYLSILLLCSVSLLMTNCATSGSSTSAQKKQGYAKTFKTGLVRANFEFKLGGMGNFAGVQYQAQVYCKHSDCNSAKTVLSFYVSSSGRNGAYISNHNLSIYAGNKSYHWNQHNWQRNLGNAMGSVAAVPLSKSELQQIAKSKKVTGVLAGNDFIWSYENRKPLRQLLKKLNKNSE